MQPELQLRQVLLPSMLVAAALGLAAAAGLGTLPLGTLELPAALAAVLGLLATLRHLGFGLALLPVVASAVPLTVGTGTQSGLVAGLLFAMLLLGLWVVRATLLRDLTLGRSPVNLPAFALMLTWSLSFLYGNAVWPSLVRVWPTFPFTQIASVAVVIVSAGVLLLAANVGREVRWIKLATWSFLAVGVLGIVAIRFHLDAGPLRFLSTGGLFSFWVVTLAYGQALTNHRLSIWLRLGLLALVGAWLYKALVVQTYWLSGWVPTVVAIGWVTLLRSRKLAFALGCAVLAWIAANFDRVYAAVWQSNLDEGSGTRVAIWTQAWNLLSQHPLLGTGPAGYAAYYMSLYANSPSSMSTHSNYVDIAAQTGLLGFGIFLSLIGALLLVGWRACRRWHDGFEGAFAQAAVGGLFGVIVAMALGDWLIPFAYNQTIGGFRYTVQSWVFLGLLAGLAEAPDLAERA